MGCGASSEPAISADNRYRSSDQDSGSGNSRSNSVSNSFTTSYATGQPRPAPKYQPTYNPGSSDADTDAEFEKWKKKNKKNTPSSNAPMSEAKQEEKIVEDFVYGDFKVDPGDVQQQRIERFNRVRLGDKEKPIVSGGLSRGASGGNLLAQSGGRRKSFGTFVMNDFTVKTVDEGDDPMYHFLHEVKVPPGFHPLQRYTVRTMHGHSSRVKVLAISPSETEFVSGAMEDQNVSMYAIANGDENTCFSGHSSPVVSAVFSRDGKYLATSSRDNTVIVWDIMHKDNAKRLVRTLDHSCLPICIEFSFDSQVLVSGCQDKKCRVWDVEHNEVKLTFDDHEGVIVCVATHAKKNVAVSGGGDRVLRLWDMETGAAMSQFIGHDGIVISVNFTPDGDRILSNDDRACKMWNVDTGACILNVTLQSLTAVLSSADFPPPMPLPKAFVDKVPLASKQLGFAPNGIFGPQAVNACKIGANRSVFTLSCLLPGSLSRSYFAVACTNKIVYIVSCATGKEEVNICAKAAVFSLAVGRENTLMFGDIFGNVSLVTVEAKE